MKIAIVGAGLAGLSAADVLIRNGHTVVVFEARDRVGGRTWTTRLNSGRLVERGAEFIYETDFALRELAARFKLPIVSHGVRFGRRTVRGQHVSSAELLDSLRRLSRICAQMQESGRRGPSLAEVAESALGPEYEKHPVFMRIATSLAGDPVNASAYSILHDTDLTRYIADEGRLLDGNQQLSLRLASSLPDGVQLNTPVKRVDQTLNGCLITDADGASYEADACVLALPLPKLRELDFGFELSEDLSVALAHLEMGVAAKLSISLNDPQPMDTAQQHDDALWWVWQSLSEDGESRVPLVTSFAGGHPALHDLRIDEGEAAWRERIEEKLPSGVSLGDSLFTDWRTDEWARGAYSYQNVDWTPQDLDALQRPIGRVVLAGEHTGTHGTMNGAVESGQRAAQRILNLASSQSPQGGDQ